MRAAIVKSTPTATKNANFMAIKSKSYLRMTSQTRINSVHAVNIAVEKKVPNFSTIEHSVIYAESFHSEKIFTPKATSRRIILQFSTRPANFESLSHQNLSFFFSCLRNIRHHVSRISFKSKNNKSRRFEHHITF